MKKHFYHHLIAIDIIEIEIGLATLDLDPKEKKELIELAENNIHHAILDTVLSELPSEDKRTFLSHVLGQDHDAVWKMLTGKVENAEEKIKKTAKEILKSIHQDIKEAHMKTA